MPTKRATRLAREARLVAASAIWLVTWSWTVRRAVNWAVAALKASGTNGCRTAALPSGGHYAGQVVDPTRAVTLVDLHHEPGLIGVGLLDELLDEQRRLRRCVGQQEQPGLRVHGCDDQRHLTLGVELVGAQQGIECGELPGAGGVAGVLRNEPEGVDQGADDRVVGPGHAVR